MVLIYYLLLRHSKHPAAMIQRHAEVFGVIFFMIFALYFDVSFLFCFEECNLEIIRFDFVAFFLKIMILYM